VTQFRALLSVAAVLGVCAPLMFPAAIAFAQDQEATTPGAAASAAPGSAFAALPAAGHVAAPKPARRYVIEFRARAANSYGHAYVIYGTVGPRGKIIGAQIAGIHPASESVVPWMIGHLVPVPSETGASDGDSEDVYTTARYRILLTEPEYRKVVAFIKNLQKTSPAWHAVLYNCVSFVKDIAVSMNLRTPVSNVAYPEVFVNNLREMNTRPDGEAVTTVPYGQWGVAPPDEKQADPAKRKPSGTQSASRTPSASGTQPVSRSTQPASGTQSVSAPLSASSAAHSTF
jgi:hypothetical protein